MHYGARCLSLCRRLYRCPSAMSCFSTCFAARISSSSDESSESESGSTAAAGMTVWCGPFRSHPGKSTVPPAVVLSTSASAGAASCRRSQPRFFGGPSGRPGCGAAGRLLKKAVIGVEAPSGADGGLAWCERFGSCRWNINQWRAREALPGRGGRTRSPALQIWSRSYMILASICIGWLSISNNTIINLKIDWFLI